MAYTLTIPLCYDPDFKLYSHLLSWLFTSFTFNLKEKNYNYVRRGICLCVRKQTLPTFMLWTMHWSSLLDTLFWFGHFCSSVESKSNTQKIYHNLSSASMSLILFIYLYLKVICSFHKNCRSRALKASLPEQQQQKKTQTCGASFQVWFQGIICYEQGGTIVSSICQLLLCSSLLDTFLCYAEYCTVRIAQ